jgi:arsenical pump membrane protein
VVDNGLGTAARTLLPHGWSSLALLAVAVAAALLANLINNLPAVLAIVPLISVGGPGPVLAPRHRRRGRRRPRGVRRAAGPGPSRP